VILIKSKKEIDLIRESCKIVAETLQLVKKNVKPGITTLELDKIAEDYIRSNDAIPAFKGYSQAGSFSFPGTICSSIDDEVVHGIPGDRALKEGEIISIDVGAKLNGYFGDAALTVAVGNISEDKLNLMKATEESLHLGINEVIAGNRLGNISYAVQNHCESRGFSVVRDLCGHGVGKKLHEDPSIPNFGRRDSGPVLKNGMTLAIEPMINMGTYEVKVARDGWTVLTKDGQPSAHFEHTIALIDGKAEILTVC
jgi:methionyl aminopeptidase